MIAACARVGANASNGGAVGSLDSAVPGGGVDMVKTMLADECDSLAAKDYQRRSRLFSTQVAVAASETAQS